MTEQAYTRRVTMEYRVNYPDPIEVTAGARVRVRQEDRDFPRWKWCEASDGRAGWVPVELLSQEVMEATVLANYSARELRVDRGETRKCPRDRIIPEWSASGLECCSV